MKLNFQIHSIGLLKFSLFISSILIIAIYLIYRTSSWPFGIEALGCLVSLFIILLFIFLITLFRNRPIIFNSGKQISIGLTIGLLWTIEIGINNIIQPGLPLRDIIDNIFWAVIVILILLFSAIEAFKTRKISAGIITGFWNGTGSGAVACLTALVFIVFGMSLILKDPLNIKEWTDTYKNQQYTDMKVYFAYQTFAGALLHLTVLGSIMGVTLGVLGGLIGKALNYISIKKHSE